MEMHRLYFDLNIEGLKGFLNNQIEKERNIIKVEKLKKFLSFLFLVSENIKDQEVDLNRRELWHSIAFLRAVEIESLKINQKFDTRVMKNLILKIDLNLSNDEICWDEISALFKSERREIGLTYKFDTLVEKYKIPKI